MVVADHADGSNGVGGLRPAGVDGSGIDELDPGPELDRLLHVEVLGGGLNEEMPAYSTDADRARALRGSLDYLEAAGAIGDFTAWASLASDPDGRPIYQVGRASTEALALSRAALKAVRAGTHESR